MTRLRILTMNLWYGRAPADALADLAVSRQVDVLAVQELGTSQVPALERILPHGRLDPTPHGTGTGIALRHETKVECLRLGQRNAWIARLEPEGWPLAKPVEVMSVHLVNPVQWPVHRSLAQRREQVETLERYLRSAAPGPRLLLGDLNSTPVWPAYRRLTRFFEDAALVLARRHRRWPARTWSLTARAPRLLRIDHVLAQGLRPERLDVIRVPGSDHSAVVCELVLPD